MSKTKTSRVRKRKGSRKRSGISLFEFDMRLEAAEAELAELRRQAEKLHLAAIERGIAQMKRGEGVPALEAVIALGKKYGIPTKPRR